MQENDGFIGSWLIIKNPKVHEYDLAVLLGDKARNVPTLPDYEAGKTRKKQHHFISSFQQ